MDRIDKELRRFSTKERAWIKTILEKIKKNDLTDLDVKRLKGKPDIFRVRKGNIRIIYRSVDTILYILTIERRGESMYKNI